MSDINLGDGADDFTSICTLLSVQHTGVPVTGTVTQYLQGLP